MSGGNIDRRQDPEKWAISLMDDLKTLGARYLEAKRSRDNVSSLDETTQILLAAIIGRVSQSFRDIPAFEANPGLAALHDVQGAFLDLYIGKKPAIFQPLESQKGASDSVSRQLVKKFALLTVRILISCGSSEKESRDFVARILTSAGHVSRKRGKITGATLWEWDAASTDRTRRYIARHHDNIVAQLDGDLAQAQAWATVRLRQPSLQSKI